MSDTVVASLVYFEPPKDGAQPYTDLANPAGRRQNWTQGHKDIIIENIRGHEDSVSLDTSGFQFYRNESGHRKFTNDEEIKREYYPESEALLRRLTGAEYVTTFDHTVRRYNPGQPDTGPDNRQPVPAVHIDQTPSSAERRVRLHVPDFAPELLKKRFQIINLWRPISHPAIDFPLALCDYRTVDPATDLVPTTMKFPGREGETYSVKYNVKHQWKYLKGMKPDEIVLIKCFDPKTDERVAAYTPHTAFIDPTAPKDAPHRESIELRALVFYEN